MKKFFKHDEALLSRAYFVLREQEKVFKGKKCFKRLLKSLEKRLGI